MNSVFRCLFIPVLICFIFIGEFWAFYWVVAIAKTVLTILGASQVVYLVFLDVKQMREVHNGRGPVVNWRVRGVFALLLFSLAYVHWWGWFLFLFLSWAAVCVKNHFVFHRN